MSDTELKKSIVTYGLENTTDLTAIDTKHIVDLCLDNRARVADELWGIFAFTQQEGVSTYFKPVHIITENLISDALYNADGDKTRACVFLNQRVSFYTTEHDPI